MWPNEGVIITMALQRGVAGEGSQQERERKGRRRERELHKDWLIEMRGCCGGRRGGVQCVSVS